MFSIDKDERIQRHLNKLRNSSFAILKIAVSPSMLNIYKDKVEAHNNSIVNKLFPDSGFDLLVPETTVITKDAESVFIDFQMKTEMFYYDKNSETSYNSAFFVYPRSSLSKTQLILANHTGIIDSGYRGSLIGAFKWLPPLRDVSTSVTIQKHARLVQICHPSLCPIYVIVVDESELSGSERGSGGFGSTGV
jgi:dUTP pyrophosphatase